jgi:uncharacterized protein YkwD
MNGAAPNQPRRSGIALSRVGFLMTVLFAASLGPPPVSGLTAADPQLQNDLFALTNADRTSNGLPALGVDERLRGVAQERSDDMLGRNYFAHEIPPSGDRVFSILETRGLSYEAAAENIGQVTGPRTAAAHDVQHTFLDSATHRANLLNTRWTVMGVGAAGSAVTGLSTGTSHSVVTVLFMRPFATTRAESTTVAIDLPGESASVGPSDLIESVVDDVLGRNLGIGGN